MKNCPVEAYGLLAYPEDLQTWWDRETENYGTDKFEREYVSVYEVNECLPNGSCTGVCENEGDIFKINDDGVYALDYDLSDNYLDFVILELERYPNLFKAAYASRKDALEYLKKTYSDILPEDFDFENRFVYYSGTELA